MMSTKYAYPAIFTPEEEGGFSVVFPDLEGCFTCGDDMADALFMAEDALALVLYGYESDGREIPAPSRMEDLKLNDGEFVNSVACDTMEYRKRFNNRDPIGKVIRILDKYTLLVDVGNDTLTVGSRIQVYEPVEMIKAPDGTELGFYNYIKDTLDVIRVEDHFSICRKKETVSKTVPFVLSPLLEYHNSEDVPLKISESDIQALSPKEPLIKIGDPIKFA